MFRHTLSLGFGGAMALVVTLAASAAHADPVRYRYVALDQVPLPAPYTFFFPSVVIDGRVFGTVYDPTFTIASVAEYDRGRITVGAGGFASVANNFGVIGGSNPSLQAALFYGSGTSLIPRLPGETSASVVGLTDWNLSLVSSTNVSSVTTFAYFVAGTETVINFGLPNPVFGAFMNDYGVIGVTEEESQTTQFLQGYRYDAGKGTSTRLAPFAAEPTETFVLVQGINNHGEILGYSYTNPTSSAYQESVGVWDTKAVFQPYFTETINTSMLVFNDEDQIVITLSSDGNSYLVPMPGTRLNLATLVPNLPAGLGLTQVVSIDNGGNITGLATDADSNFYPFLLQALGENEAGPWGVGTVNGCALPPAVTTNLGKRHPRK
jgi:hypothetical protein